VSVTRREGLRDHVEIIHSSGFLSFVKRLTTSKEQSYRTPHSFHEQVDIAYVKTKRGQRKFNTFFIYVYIAVITKLRAGP